MQVSIVANAGKSNRCGRRSRRTRSIRATGDPIAALATVARPVSRRARRAVVDGWDQVAGHAVHGDIGRGHRLFAVSQDAAARLKLPGIIHTRVERDA